LRAAVYRGRDDVRVEELPVPEPGRGEVLVKVDACGVCPTDIKKIHKALQAPPRIFGHEIAGSVAALGPGATGVREGDRVVVLHHMPCFACFYCARQEFAQCPFFKKNGTTAGFEPAGGGYAEYLKAFDWIVGRGLIPVPAGVEPQEALFVEPVLTCLKAVVKAGVARGETCLVVGQGPIGLLLMQLVRAAGAGALVTDPLPERRQLALRLGATVALHPGSDVVAELRGLTEGRGADVAFVAVGGREPFAQAVSATRPAGRIMSFAATSPGETAEVDLGLLTTEEKQILTSYSSTIDLRDRAAALVFSREVRVKELVSHRLPIARAPEAFALAGRPAPGTLKVILDMAAGG
jgi:L-iditol 2-dehydrogenase